jgi:hypothetical protein
MHYAVPLALDGRRHVAGDGLQLLARALKPNNIFPLKPILRLLNLLLPAYYASVLKVGTISKNTLCYTTITFYVQYQRCKISQDSKYLTYVMHLFNKNSSLYLKAF